MISPLAGGPAAQARPPSTLYAAAQQMESLFLAQMLEAAGLDSARGSFGGGAGEAQFASFLRQEQASMMADAGGIGLAEALFKSMTERANDAG